MKEGNAHIPLKRKSEAESYGHRLSLRNKKK